MLNPQHPFIGRELGSYRVESFLDEGGMGDIYSGTHKQLGNSVAIKILKENFARNDKRRKEFQEEAIRIAHLDHPHIIRIFDCGFIDEKPYLVMPLAQGSLKSTQGKILSLEVIIGYIKQITEALQYAHDRGIVHRDIKPGNFLIGSRGEILLSDFGIATITHSVNPDTQQFAGTPQYLPPEQWKNQAVRASDQYALGICVYQWLCGDLPFHGSLEQLMWAHIQEDPPSFQKKKVVIAQDIEKVVMKALAKEPHQRFASIQTFATALEQAYSSQQALQKLREDLERTKKELQYKCEDLEAMQNELKKWVIKYSDLNMRYEGITVLLRSLFENVFISYKDIWNKYDQLKNDNSDKDIFVEGDIYDFAQSPTPPFPQPLIDSERQEQEIAALQAAGFQCAGKGQHSPTFDSAGQPIPSSTEWILEVYVQRINGFITVVFHCPASYPAVPPRVQVRLPGVGGFKVSTPNAVRAWNAQNGMLVEIVREIDDTTP